MLNNIEKLYLNTYRKRYGPMTPTQIAELIEETEHQFITAYANSDAQRKAAYALMEQVQYAALDHVETVGHKNDVIFMASGTLSETDGLLEPLPKPVHQYLGQETPAPYWYMDNSAGDWYLVYIDIPYDGHKGAELRKLFSTANTAPRMVLKSFVLTRINPN